MQVFQRLTLDTIGQCALAMRVNCQRDKDDQFLAMVELQWIVDILQTLLVAGEGQPGSAD